MGAPWAAAGDVGPDGPAFAFYRDAYGGALEAPAYAEALPAALRCVRGLCGGMGPEGLCGDGEALLAWGRACCAAADAFAEFGEGRVGGYAISPGGAPAARRPTRSPSSARAAWAATRSATSG